LDLKIGFGLGMYYSIMFLLFFAIGAMVEEAGIDESGNTTATFNVSSFDNETDRGGFFTIGVGFDRFFDWVSFAVFLPSDTPEWFTNFFTVWQTLINILTIMWVFASIWNG